VRILLLTALLLSTELAASGQTAAAPYSQTLTQSGTTVTVNIQHADRSRSASDALREFENVLVQVRFADAASKSALAGGSPAAWIDRKSEGQQITPAQCAGKVKRFAEGSTFSHTEMDLTSYFVVILNGDATLTVADPRFGYGDTRLLALVQLDGPGEDWALTADGRRLFVSVPSANEVVAIDTSVWKVIGTAAAIPRAGRVGLQPDEAYLWVAYGGDAEDSGVAVLNASDMKVVARIPTGRGYHHMTFTGDSSFAFVSNPLDGAVSVIDVRRLAKTADVRVGERPVWIAYSDLAKAAYVANEGDGKIVAIDAVEHRIRATMNASPGLGQIRFAPGGRFALAVNPADDRVYVIDAASDRIVQQGKLDKGPDQIAFTNRTAHIRHRGSDVVLMIALASLGTPDAEISAADFSGGRHAPGAMSRATPADGIVQASGENAVLVANPGDRAVYFYMEGSAAPMGNLSNYGREPRAVLSVDRNLRERSPGVYETSAKLPAAGSYDLALFLDRPRIVSCLELTVAPDPALMHPQPPKLKVEPRVIDSATAGEPARLAFRLTDAGSGKPDTDAKDVVILMAGPMWQRREVASHRGDGIYAVEFKVPAPGIYNVFLSSQSRGLAYRQYATVTITGRSN
jgi:DNA-binding beta-propeller fold protein YncE